MFGEQSSPRWRRNSDPRRAACHCARQHHNHFDHLGGVRTFVAEGATVITDDRNRNFYQRVGLAPQSRSLQPDWLSQRPFAPTGPGTLAVQTFTDQYTISDGNETIELYHVDGLNHSDKHADRLPPEGEDRDQR